jgi:hypothetical protein
MKDFRTTATAFVITGLPFILPPAVHPLLVAEMNERIFNFVKVQFLQK